jgi:putative transposase
VAGMRWPQVSYTQRFNARHKECWHLFQGRYKALPVGREGGYFSAVIETRQMGIQ